ncbi:hypothetical protein [Actinomyces vulturis]|uniref:hypothetical protein n=1 Tax=Actinomyces vulturis TaxID=1857645 RepID=UPI000829699D|nr:hypothetical protein [Actinomyces vulturis]
MNATPDHLQNPASLPEAWVQALLRCPRTSHPLTPATAPDGSTVLLNVIDGWMYPVVHGVPLLLPNSGIHLDDTND